jgi:acyl-coenzyme A synthetase/AMP-(fatty) acid ligase
MAVRVGATLVLENAYAYPAAILNTIRREQVTGLPGVPTLFALLLSRDLSHFDLSSLRYLTNTGAALPVDQIRRLEAAVPQAQIYSMYGLTECKRALYLPPELLSHAPSSVGMAIPGTEAWVERADGSRAAAGEIGELVVRGSHVMRGYWNDPELTGRFFAPGPTPGERILRTGDLFSCDEEGFFYFVSRRDAIIKSHGQKVAPLEVERAICEMEGVLEAAVVGVPDSIAGHSITAFVRTSDERITENHIRRHCAGKLEVFKRPRSISIVSELPRTENGKIDTRSLERGESSEDAVTEHAGAPHG